MITTAEIQAALKDAMKKQIYTACNTEHTALRAAVDALLAALNIENG